MFWTYKQSITEMTKFTKFGQSYCQFAGFDLKTRD